MKFLGLLIQVFRISCPYNDVNAILMWVDFLYVLAFIFSWMRALRARQQYENHMPIRSAMVHPRSRLSGGIASTGMEILQTWPSWSRRQNMDHARRFFFGFVLFFFCVRNAWYIDMHFLFFFMCECVAANWSHGKASSFYQSTRFFLKGMTGLKVDNERLRERRWPTARQLKQHMSKMSALWMDAHMVVKRKSKKLPLPLLRCTAARRSGPACQPRVSHIYFYVNK